MKIPFVGAGNGKLFSSPNAQNIVTRGTRLNFFHKQSVDEQGAVNTGESIRPELFLDGGYRPAKHVRTREPMKQEVVSLSRYRHDLGRINEQDLAPCLDGDSRRFCQPRRSLR